MKAKTLFFASFTIENRLVWGIDFWALLRYNVAIILCEVMCYGY